MCMLLQNSQIQLTTKPTYRRNPQKYASFSKLDLTNMLYVSYNKLKHEKQV